jgi:hypothetical protein
MPAAALPSDSLVASAVVAPPPIRRLETPAERADADTSWPDFLDSLKNHAADLSLKLQTESSCPDPLWQFVHSSILDGKSAGAAYRQYLIKEEEHNSLKSQVKRQRTLIDKLTATLSPGEPEGDDITTEKAKLKKIEKDCDNAHDLTSPSRILLYRSVLACMVCRFGTETQPSSFYSEQMKHTESLPNAKDELNSIISDQVTRCWKAHGFEKKYEEKDLAHLLNDDTMLLRSAIAWTKGDIKEPTKKPKVSGGGKLIEDKAARATALVAATSDHTPPASATGTLADVTAPVEHIHKDGDTVFSVAVKITCDELCAGRAIRMSAVDCLVGAKIKYFTSNTEDGKILRAPRKDRAVCHECVIMVLEVAYQSDPELLILKKSPADLQILPIADSGHSRWLGALMFS